MNSRILCLILALAFFSACDVKKRDPRTPAPTVKKFSTKFFFEYSEDGKTYKPKRFLFGSSIEDKIGDFAGYFIDHYNTAGSANIEFDFNEDGTRLLAWKVNPTYPNNRKKWDLFLSFAVSQNFYEENVVDTTGRTQTDQVRRSDRSDPRARPYIILELDSMRYEESIQPWHWNMNGKRIQRVEDIEGGQEGDDFLGFTALSTSLAFGTGAQTLDRINFLRMNPNEKDFEETPYHQDNSRHIQILHIVGEKPHHYGEKLKAIHWDINKKTKKKYRFHIHNFPKEYEQIGIDSVESWNDTFEKAVGYRPFDYVISNRKYAFDLRYHTIHWVDDIALSATGPLGLANVAADVTNGKVLWTGSIIWGGLMHTYAGSNLPSVSTRGASAFSRFGAHRGHDLSFIVPKDRAVWNQPEIDPYGTSPDLDPQKSYEDNFLDFATLVLREGNENWKKTLMNEKIKELDGLFYSKDESKKIDSNEYEVSLSRYKAKLDASQDFMSENTFRKFYATHLSGYPLKNQMSLDNAEKAMAKKPISLDWMHRHEKIGVSFDQLPSFFSGHIPDTTDQRADLPMHAVSQIYGQLPEAIRNKVDMAPGLSFQASFDHDHSALETIREVTAAMEKVSALTGRLINVEDVKRALIRYTIVHEMGHTFGLGHNFEANIMPEKGHVPNSVYDPLWAKAQKDMTNQSTVMGYPAGETSVLQNYQDLVPGPNDYTRIMYLYEQKYPMYDKTGDGSKEYTWRTLGKNGRIKDEDRADDGSLLTTAYLPNCNDFEAFFYVSPYCNRFTRGYNARTIMESSFERYWDLIYRNLESNIDALKSRNYWAKESYLWQLSAKTLNRARLFHDYMRLKYKDYIDSLREEDDDIKRTFKNMLGFSKSCEEVQGLYGQEREGTPEERQASLQKDLAKKLDSPSSAVFLKRDVDGNVVASELGDLCMATLTMLKNMENLLQIEGNEYTEIDYFDRRVPGGMRSGDGSHRFTQIYGSWKKLSLLPIKFKILQNLLLPYPTMTYHVWDVPLFPYNGVKASFSVSTLFPREYLGVVKELVKSAVEYEDLQKEPKILRSLLYMGYFSRFQEETGDKESFPIEILKEIRGQTQFRYSNAFVEIEAIKQDSSDDPKTFKGSIWNRHNESGKEGIGEIYLYKMDKFIMNAQSNSLALPLTPIRWLTDVRGISAGLKLDYQSNIHFPELDSYSPRKFFIDNYEKVMRACIEGNNESRSNGLSSFFTQGTAFEGFNIPSDIGTNGSRYLDVNKSIEKGFDQFQEIIESSDEETKFKISLCSNALKAQRALVLGGSLMGGLFFYETNNILETGANQ